MKRIYQALFAFLTSLGVLLLANLCVIITKDQWPLFQIPDILVTVLLFITFPIYGLTSYQFGKRAQIHRERPRVEYYQLEPHGIKFTQKAR